MIKDKSFLVYRKGSEIARINFELEEVQVMTDAGQGFVVISFDEIDEINNFIHRGETKDD